MKILFVNLGTYSRIGGVERFNQRVVRCLAELMGRELKDCHVIALWDTPEDAARVPEGVAFTPASESKVRAALAFAGHVRAMRPDVILYGHVLLAPLAGLARVLSPRSRNVLVVHGIEVWGPPYRRIPPGERWVIRSFIDRIVAVSEFTLGRMRSAYRIALDSCSILPNAIDLQSTESLSARERSQPGAGARLLTVGRLEDRYKGCDQVIRALPSLVARYPTVQYEIVGDGSLRSELEALAGRLNMSSHVRFLGQVDDRALEDAYRRATVFVMPSKGEGFGIVYLEAWRHCLPVIAGNRDAAAEVVQDGVNGLLVNPDSVDELTRALFRVLEDRELAARLGQNGYQTLVDRYTHERFKHNLAGILMRC